MAYVGHGVSAMLCSYARQQVIQDAWQVIVVDVIEGGAIYGRVDTVRDDILQGKSYMEFIGQDMYVLYKRIASLTCFGCQTGSN